MDESIRIPRLGLYLQLARPHQYVKNCFIFLPLFFGYRIGDLEILPNIFIAFLSFCLVASSVYVINDMVDVNEDRQHPIKCLRPLASGDMNTVQALLFLTLLLLTAITTALILRNHYFILILIAYFSLNLAYSFFLKHIAIVDVVCISVGFVLRVAAGGVIADVPISHWIIIMTFLLALFLAFAKRRDDCLLSTAGRNTRKCSDSYNLEFVSISMAVMGSVIIVAYLLYTVSPETVKKHGTDQLYLTGLWVILGLLRYMQITFVEERSGSPTKIFLQDYFLQAIIFLWIASFFLLSYHFKH
jgi:decaprenyl-phosphate phosphoribosyltransferase